MIGGIWKEIVYDNMRNVVSKLIEKNEKELNEDLVKMSLYYGFEINVTNAFSGNEKGYVEGSVKYLRNSYVLKSNPKLKSIFDKYYTNNPKKFIDIISKKNCHMKILIENCIIQSLSKNLMS